MGALEPFGILETSLEPEGADRYERMLDRHLKSMGGKEGTEGKEIQKNFT